MKGSVKRGEELGPCLLRATQAGPSEKDPRWCSPCPPVVVLELSGQGPQDFCPFPGHEALKAELPILQVKWPGIIWMGGVGRHIGDSEAGSRPQRQKSWLAPESLKLD